MSQQPQAGSLAVLVRQRREAGGLSIDDLVARARVSRSALHRIERGHALRPTPPKVAQVLTVLGVEPDEVRQVLDDEQFADDVVRWMRPTRRFPDMSKGPLRASLIRALEPTAEPLLIAIKGDHATRLCGDGIEEVRAVLESAGWAFLRPV